MAKDFGYRPWWAGGDECLTYEEIDSLVDFANRLNKARKDSAKKGAKKTGRRGGAKRGRGRRGGRRGGRRRR